jgi:hypothetical protein
MRIEVLMSVTIKIAIFLGYDDRFTHVSKKCVGSSAR